MREELIMGMNPLTYRDLQHVVSDRFLLQVITVPELLMISPVAYQEMQNNGELAAVEDARVLFMQDPQSKAWGGCLLRSQAPELKCETLSDVYFASHTFFELHEDSEMHDDSEEFDQLLEDFYSELLINTLQYGIERGCHILTIQSPEEHTDSRMYGRWQYTESHVINGRHVLSYLGSPREQLRKYESRH